NLVAERGPTALEAAPRAYPLIAPIRYDDRLDLQQATAAADLVIVHEWNDPRVVRDLGALRKRAAPFRLLFHDTHHRSATSPHEIARYDLSGRSEEHTSELQSLRHLVCRLLLEKKKKQKKNITTNKHNSITY